VINLIFFYLRQKLFIFNVIFFIILFFIPINVLSQKINLEIKSSKVTNLLPNYINTNSSYSDSISAIIALKKNIKTLINEGYASVVIDSIVKQDNNIIAYIDIGSKYKWLNLSVNSYDYEILVKTGFKQREYINKPFRYNDFKILAKKIIKYFGKNGYPYVTVSLDSIIIEDIESKVSANLKIEAGPLIKIDSIIINKEAAVSSVFLNNYLNIKPGSLYNERKINEIEKKLKELKLITLTGHPLLLIRNNKANIYIKAEKKKVNVFSGIMGFMTDNTSSKFILTGDLNLRLYNTFKYGELLGVNWYKTNIYSQEIKTVVGIPYLFNTQIGVENKLNILKKDTTYFTVNERFGIKYFLNYLNYFNAYYENKVSKLINTNGLENVKVLPFYADIKSIYYGIELYKELFDYRNNPLKGYSILLNFSLGVKQIIRNAKINQIVYDSIALKSMQYRVIEETSVFIPLGGRNTIGLFNKSAVITGNRLFTNELFRIGGLKTLRGFDEEIFYASKYSIFTLEYRYLFGENSYIQAFCDVAYYEANILNNYIKDTPCGIGTGLTFETKAGLFSFFYALGTNRNNSFSIKSGKIHFGIVETF